MRTSHAFGLGLVIVAAGLVSACASRTPPANTAQMTPLRLPEDATAIDFVLVTGSCWGTSSESRHLEIEPEGGIVVSANALDGETKRSPAWWRSTRRMLDDGLGHASAEPRGSIGSCEGRPNFVCGFDLEVTTPRGKTQLHGCCTERGAHKVANAFGRLKPGAALAAEEVPEER